MFLEKVSVRGHKLQTRRDQYKMENRYCRLCDPAELEEETTYSSFANLLPAYGSDHFLYRGNLTFNQIFHDEEQSCVAACLPEALRFRKYTHLSEVPWFLLNWAPSFGRLGCCGCYIDILASMRVVLALGTLS